MTSPRPMVFVEPNAHRPGGHWTRTLTEVVAAATAAGHPVVVVAPHGITCTAQAAVSRAGAVVVCGAAFQARARVLLSISNVAAGVAGVLVGLPRRRRLPLPVRRFPHQVTLVARCLAEAASLRTAREVVGARPVVVIMTASEALHAAATVLGGAVHLRVVHEVFTTEDLPVRALDRLFGRGNRRVLAVATTPWIQADLAARFPGLPTATAPFAVVDPAAYVTGGERRHARTALGVRPTNAVAVLIGGWWPGKAPAVVAEALHLVDRELHMVIAGHPLDDAVLDRIRSAPGVHLQLLDRVLPDAELRQVYAAADVAVVSRDAACRKESGLVVDAARLGVPLLVSDHDSHLTEALSGARWALTFQAGDPADLAAQLRRALDHPLPRPGPADASVLGIPTADQSLARYLALHASIGPRR